EVLLAVAESFAGIAPPVSAEEQEPEPLPPPTPPPPPPQEDASLVETMQDRVARVEVFPDAEGKWYARSVDDMGTILKTTNGSFDKTYVISDAGQRWPRKEIHELADAQMDSIWNEQHHAFGWNSRRRPSPRRLWG